MAKEPCCTAFARDIQKRRIACDMTVEDLADRSGIPPHCITELESGERDPSLSMVLSIAKAFGITPDELLRSLLPELSEAAMEAARLFDESRGDLS